MADVDRYTYAYSCLKDAARAIKELCASVRELQAQLKDCQDVRDSWCAAYTDLRDTPQNLTN